MSAILERLAVVPLDEVLPHITPEKTERVDVHGGMCFLGGLRLFTFKEKGTRCIKCGCEGSFFAVERHKQQSVGNGPYHLNLYSVVETPDSREERLMTHDHTIARSDGGRDTIDNTQPMCEVCNFDKSIDEGKRAFARSLERGTIGINAEKNKKKKLTRKLKKEKK